MYDFYLFFVIFKVVTQFLKKLYGTHRITRNIFLVIFLYYFKEKRNEYNPLEIIKIIFIKIFFIIIISF